MHLGDDTAPRPGTFLTRLDHDSRRKLAGLGTAKKFGPGERLMTVGDPGGWVMLIRTGVAQVVGEDATGASVILDIAAAGDLIGEAAVLDEDHAQRMASVVAVSPVVVRRIAGHTFQRFLADHAEAAIALLVIANRRMRVAQRQRSAAQAPVSLQHIAERLDYLLDACGYPNGDTWHVGVSWTRTELAQFIPTGRTTLINALTLLHEHGIVHRGRKVLRVTDRTRLTALAHGQLALPTTSP